MSHYEIQERKPKSSGARAASVLFGVPGALLLGTIVWLRVGSAAWGLVAGSLVFVIALSTLGLTRGPSIAIALLMVGVFGVTLFYGVTEALAIYRAVSTTDGPVDDADPVEVAGANRAIGQASDDTGFRIEMTEAEIGAFLQDGLRDVENNPIRRIDIDIEDGPPGDQGTLLFSGIFKSGDLDFTGRIGFSLEAGTIEVEVLELELGDLDMPGIGRRAVQDILSEVSDLNEALGGLDADIQSVALGGDRMIVTGTQSGGYMVTSEALLDALAAHAAGIGSDIEAPALRIGPGEVDELAAAGSPVVVALGDSLAANVGVESPRLGYVSRVHAELQRRDETEYGLQNFSIPGETTGTLIRRGQLGLATSYMVGADVDYVLVDIGANDLLGHLGSDDCASDIRAPACVRRLDAALATAQENLKVIFDGLVGAAPRATIVYLAMYNPFSLGLGAEFEGQSDGIVAAFNDMAADLAEDRGIVVADGFSPMKGITAATTHMLETVPDIHPNRIGHDLLAWAIVTAIYGA
ncbi:MAG TPA: SGNH/GDSL hydrolase family protein [Acidimicrobiia bacterium]|nr:SGNH/GDSL hydrolase family protein [Acidimicrobiia bacterium]